MWSSSSVSASSWCRCAGAEAPSATFLLGARMLAVGRLHFRADGVEAMRALLHHDGRCIADCRVVACNGNGCHSTFVEDLILNAAALNFRHYAARIVYVLVMGAA